MRVRSTGALLLALSCSAAPAMAQVPSAKPASSTAPQKAVLPHPLKDAMTNKARDLYAEGVQAMGQGRVAEARAAFVGAWALEQHYSIACNLGDAELRLGRHREAAERLALCVREIEKDAKATEAERAAVKKLLADARAKAVELVVKLAAGAQEPAKVAVSIDGVAAGTVAPDLVLFLDAGKHVIVLEAEGYEMQRMEVDGAAGSRKELAAEMKKKPAALPTASVTVTTAPPPPPRSMVPGLVLGGAAVVSAAVGTGLLAGSRAEYDKTVKLGGEIRAAGGTCKAGAPAFDACCADAEGAAHTSNALKVGGIVGFAVAGAAAAAAVAYWLWPSPKPTQAAVRMVPIGAQGTGGVIVSGRF